LQLCSQDGSLLLHPAGSTPLHLAAREHKSHIVNALLTTPPWEGEEEKFETIRLKGYLSVDQEGFTAAAIGQGEDQCANEFRVFEAKNIAYKHHYKALPGVAMEDVPKEQKEEKAEKEVVKMDEDEDSEPGLSDEEDELWRKAELHHTHEIEGFLKTSKLGLVRWNELTKEAASVSYSARLQYLQQLHFVTAVNTVLLSSFVFFLLSSERTRR
jgi:hypothetical protein